MNKTDQMEQCFIWVICREHDDAWPQKLSDGSWEGNSCVPKCRVTARQMSPVSSRKMKICTWGWFTERSRKRQETVWPGERFSRHRNNWFSFPPGTEKKKYPENHTEETMCFKQMWLSLDRIFNFLMFSLAFKNYTKETAYLKQIGQYRVWVFKFYFLF